MTSKKRNTSSRTAKLRRQAKARAERSTRTAPDWAPFPPPLKRSSRHAPSGTSVCGAPMGRSKSSP